jgi:hypothetical protein
MRPSTARLVTVSLEGNKEGDQGEEEGNEDVHPPASQISWEIVLTPLLLNIIGVWLIGDGLVSMWLYMNQSYAEQAFRMIRALIGLALLLYGVSISG